MSNKPLILILIASSTVLSCNQKASSSKTQTTPKTQKVEKIGEKKAKELVLINYNKVFSTLFVQSRANKNFAHPPTVYPEQLVVSPSGPNVWKVSYTPLAGTFFHARVDRNSGFVEWIQVDHGSE